MPCTLYNVHTVIVGLEGTTEEEKLKMGENSEGSSQRTEQHQYIEDSLSRLTSAINTFYVKLYSNKTKNFQEGHRKNMAGK